MTWERLIEILENESKTNLKLSTYDSFSSPSASSSILAEFINVSLFVLDWSVSIASILHSFAVSLFLRVAKSAGVFRRESDDRSRKRKCLCRKYYYIKISTTTIQPGESYTLQLVVCLSPTCPYCHSRLQN